MLDRRAEERQQVDPEQIEVRMEVDVEAYADILRLQRRLHSPNMATAVWNSVDLVNTLYEKADNGFRFIMTRDGVEIEFRLPR